MAIILSKATWQHLRVPFSFFLMPVFWLGVATVEVVHWPQTWLAFVCLHLLLYPASNGYNSYYDRDEESIGGLRTPPPVSIELLRASWLADVLGLMLGLGVGGWFVVGMLLYGAASKAYSHPAIRLKKRPFAGLIIVGVFQGLAVCLMAAMAAGQLSPEELRAPEYLIPALLSTVLLMGSYPMTQIYQHGEDGRRGDQTLSRLLGIRGTFVFTAAVFAVAGGGFVWYYLNFFGLWYAVTFQLALVPVLIYFVRWALEAWRNPAKADFDHTMRLNLLSSLCMNAFFGAVVLLRHW